MTKPLSPAAQAVLDAAFSAYWSAEQEAPNDAHVIAAAALRAAANYLWVDKPDGANGVYEAHRAQLLAIAEELEGTN
jgi:hypothetical protein